MPQTIRTSLILQAAIFAVVFTGYFIVEKKAYPEDVNFTDSFVAYFTWLPAMWGGIIGGFLAYVFLFLIALASLFLSMKQSFRSWSLLTFNLSTLLWTIFPAAAYQFGEYHGP